MSIEKTNEPNNKYRDYAASLYIEAFKAFPLEIPENNDQIIEFIKMCELKIIKK